MNYHSRRTFLRSIAITAPGLGALAPLLLRAAEKASDAQLPPFHQFTKDPRFHWFG